MDFLDEMEESRDLDELIVAHERYLNAFVEKSFLGERSHHLYKTLFSLLSLFDLILHFRSHGDRLYESSHEMRAMYIVAFGLFVDKIGPTFLLYI